MSMTEQDRVNHDRYEAMRPTVRNAIDEAFSAAVKELKAGIPGLELCKCDGAEQLIAALARYVHESFARQRGI